MSKSYLKARQANYSRDERSRHTRWRSGRRGLVYRRVCFGVNGEPKLIVIKEKNALTKHGYSVKACAAVRRNALKKAVDEYSALSVYRKLMAQYVFRRNYEPETAATFKADAEWVKQAAPW